MSPAYPPTYSSRTHLSREPLFCSLYSPAGVRRRRRRRVRPIVEVHEASRRHAEREGRILDGAHPFELWSDTNRSTSASRFVGDPVPIGTTVVAVSTESVHPLFHHHYDTRGDLSDIISSERGGDGMRRQREVPALYAPGEKAGHGRYGIFVQMGLSSSVPIRGTVPKLPPNKMLLPHTCEAPIFLRARRQEAGAREQHHTTAYRLPFPLQRRRGEGMVMAFQHA